MDQEQNITNSQTGSVSSNTSSSQTNKKQRYFIVIIIALMLLLCVGIGFSIFQTLKYAEANDKVTELEKKITLLQEQLKKEQAETPTDKEPVDDTDQKDDTNQDVAVKQYLEPEDWNVRFAYPDGVTEVLYHVQDTPWNGALYIDSITKNGKTYNVDMFGGKDSYKSYSFFFGEVARWKKTNPHDQWTGSIVDMKLGLTNGEYEYYTWDKGNGYESGSAADYEEACGIVSELFNNIEAK